MSFDRTSSICRIKECNNKKANHRSGLCESCYYKYAYASSVNRKKGASVTAEEWDRVKKLNSSLKDVKTITKDTGLSRSTVQNIVCGKLKRPEPKE